MSIDERVAIISGGGRGIGAATARELGRLGCHVVVNYLHDRASAEAVVKDVVSAGGSAGAFQADVTDAAQVDALVETVVREHGRIDVLVCNANVEQPTPEPLPDLSWEQFSRKIHRELGAAYFLTKRVLETMVAHRRGSVVYLSSIGADLIAEGLAHGVAKAALNAFSRNIAEYARPHGVTVNTVSPGPVGTDAVEGVLTDAERRYIAERTVSGQLLVPADVARVIGMLVDGGSGSVTGQVITVDGGLTLQAKQLRQGSVS
ncbi:SDR family NAD(P)-dependent oxidoreductase [Actinophytocola sediminis]